MTDRQHFLVGVLALVIAVGGVLRADYVVAVAAALIGAILITTGVRQGPSTK